MKSKRLMGIIVLAVCAMMLLCEVGQASTYIEGVTYYNPEDYQSSRYTQYKYNCKLFANVVVKDTTYSYGLPGWNNPDPNNHEMRYYPGWDDNLVAMYLNDQNGNRGPSASHLENVIFANAKQCDVVQMYWNSTEHTALISGFNNNGQAGVWFFEANVSGENGKEINNHFYTYERLASSYGNAGSKGGVSIYRFGKPIPKIDPPKITDVPNIALIADLDASYQCKADGNGLTWSVSGALPPGMSINSSTGEISGKPSSTSQGRASYYAVGYSFKVTAKNSAGSSTKSAYISVYEPPVITTNSTLPNGKIGKSYSQTIRAEGTEMGMTWKLKSFKLPSGMTVSYNENSRVATLSGTPAQSGPYGFTLELKNSSTVSVTKAFTFTIEDTTPEIYPESNMWIEESFKNGTIGEYYSSTVRLYFRSLVYLSRWKAQGSNVSVVSGSLPPGLKLSWASSVSGIDSKGTWADIELSGTPTTAGSYQFIIRAQNSQGGYADSKKQPVTISKPSRPFADSSMSFRYTFMKGKLGVTYNDYLVVWGGTSPYTVVKTLGTMPPGLELKQSGRYVYLRGIPTRYGKYSFTLRATGAHNGYVDQEFTVNIANNSAYLRVGAGEEDEDNPTKPKLATTKIPNALAYSEYNVTFEAGGTQPITWSYTGDLPEGFVFTDSGTLAGIPTEAGKFKFKVTAANSLGSASKSFTLKVLPQKPVINDAALPDGTVGEPYSYTIDSEGEAIKWSKSGKFPKGLKIDKNTGEIYGTPTAAGTYTFKIKAKNKAGKETAEFTMTIAENLEDNITETTTTETPAVPVNSNSLAASLRTEAVSIAELYLLRNGEEISDSAEVPAGVPLTFRAGELPDEDDEDSESLPVISGLKVFVDDEELDGAETASDGTFTVPAEVVNGTFSVYASGFMNGEEFETSEIEIQAAGDSEGSAESSGGCSVNFAGMILLLMSGFVLMKK